MIAFFVDVILECKFLYILNLTRCSCEKCNCRLLQYRPSGRNRTCGPGIPVQRLPPPHASLFYHLHLTPKGKLCLFKQRREKCGAFFSLAALFSQTRTPPFPLESRKKRRLGTRQVQRSNQQSYRVLSCLPIYKKHPVAQPSTKKLSTYISSIERDVQ